MRLAMIVSMSLLIGGAVLAAETPDGVPIETRKFPDGRTLRVPVFRTMQMDGGLAYIVRNKTYSADEFHKRFPVVSELLSGDYARVNHEVGSSSEMDDDRQVDVYHYDGKKYGAEEFKKTFPHKYAVLKMLSDKRIDGVLYEDSQVPAREIPTEGAEDAKERGDSAIAIETTNGVRRYKVDGKEISEKEFNRRFPKTAEKLKK
jgi:hypothetical protein